MASPVTILGVQITLPDQGDTFAWGAALRTALTQLAAAVQQGPAAVYQNSAGQTITTAGGPTRLNFPTLIEDTGSPNALVVNPSTAWLFTCPVAGDYVVSCSINLQTITGVTRFVIAVQKNNAETWRLFDNGTGGAGLGVNEQIAGSSGVIPCAADDTLDVYAQCVGGTSVTTISGSGFLNSISVKKVL